MTNKERVIKTNEDTNKIIKETISAYPNGFVSTDKERNIFIAYINTNLTEISFTLADIADTLSEIKNAMVNEESDV